MARNYSNIAKDIPAMSTYRGYMTHDPEEALAAYKETTGFDGTVIVIRPNFEVTADHPLLVTSRHSAANIILVSHLLAPQDIVDSEPDGLAQYKDKVVHVRTAIPSGKVGDIGVPKHKVGRPPALISKCPHCQGRIEDFNDLGYWYGWGFGITPPYWEELSSYVFRRDDYTCQHCWKKFGSVFLTAHHVVHKEDGGSDSARNLQTLCIYCHEDNKPLYSDEENL